MKKIDSFINEKLKMNTKTISKQKYNYSPMTKEEFSNIIYKLIKERGDNANLNDIDTSHIDDMSYLFFEEEFNGDISGWDVSNVETMEGMFTDSYFNGDISGWDVSNVKTMEGMFYDSRFNDDISNWDVSNVENMESMFANSKFSGDLSNWDVRSLKYTKIYHTFWKCPLQNNPPEWYKKYSQKYREKTR